MGKLLQKLGDGQGYLKAGFLGFPKSGKTYTAVLLAIAVMREFNIKSPLAMFDTEGGSEYIAKMVKQLTGNDLLGVRSRGFHDLLDTAAECEKEGIEIFLIDSITHPWRELCDAYLESVNKKRKQKNQKPRTRLEFQDWNQIKPRWGKWTDWYLNSNIHVIICGRAGYEYDYEINDETQRKELMKTGIKMKTETEFGFEPSLLIEMEREQVNEGTRRLSHRAIVLGDRFGLIDGSTTEFKKGKNLEAELKVVHKFFLPHLKALTPGSHAPVDTEVKSEINVDENGDGEWQKERRERQILAEEVKGELLRIYPGTAKEDKVGKAELIELAFGTRSWTKVENMNSEKLRDGLDVIRNEIAERMREENDSLPTEDLFDNSALLSLAWSNYRKAYQGAVPEGKRIDRVLWMAVARKSEAKLESEEDITEFNVSINIDDVLVAA